MADDATKTNDDPLDAEPNEKDEFGLDQKRMTFLEHLLELRWRIMICVGTVLGATILFFVVLRKPMFDWLTYPVMAACKAVGGKVKYEDLLFVRTPQSLFMASVYYCLLGAVAVTIPVTVWQLWAFVAPGLKKKERRLIGPAIVSTMVLFLAGAAFAYYVIIPIMLVFFLQDTLWLGPRPIWDIADTIKLEALMMLILGVTFELPIVIVLLSKIGIVSPRFLAKYRRHAILVIFIVAALLTPTGDPVTLTLMSVPLIVLYELGIIAAKFFRPRRAKWDVPEEDDKGGPPPEPPEPSPPPSEPPTSAPLDQPPPEGQPGEGASYTEESGYQPEEGMTDETAPPEEPAPPAEEPTPPPEPEPPMEEPPAEAPPPGEELPPDALMH
ncbi:MAG TPA: twin-arginine translocase subunit TatC [Planctomycetota bacterium]|nr:twin-arginine translocase subunit TatC [Planctomycetota bacterium]